MGRKERRKERKAERVRAKALRYDPSYVAFVTSAEKEAETKALQAQGELLASAV